MALPVIDVTCLEGRDGELVVKDLAVAGFQSSRASAYAFKKLHSWEEVPGYNARIIVHLIMDVIGMLLIYCILSWSLLRIERHHPL